MKPLKTRKDGIAQRASDYEPFVSTLSNIKVHYSVDYIILSRYF